MSLVEEQVRERLRLLVDAVHKKDLGKTTLFLDDIKSHITKVDEVAQSSHLCEFFGQGLICKLTSATKSSHWKQCDSGSKQKIYNKVCEVMQTFQELGGNNVEVAKLVGMNDINPYYDLDLDEETLPEDNKNICSDSKLNQLIHDMGCALKEVWKERVLKGIRNELKRGGD